MDRQPVSAMGIIAVRPGFPQFLTVLPLAAISSAIGAGRAGARELLRR